MGLHAKTIKYLEDGELIEDIKEAVKRGYGYAYIQKKYGISRRVLLKILKNEGII